MNQQTDILKIPGSFLTTMKRCRVVIDAGINATSDCRGSNQAKTPGRQLSVHSLQMIQINTSRNHNVNSYQQSQPLAKDQPSPDQLVNDRSIIIGSRFSCTKNFSKTCFAATETCQAIRHQGNWLKLIQPSVNHFILFITTLREELN